MRSNSLLFLSLFSGLTHAADASPAAALPEADAALRWIELRGSVSQVDLANRTLQIEDPCTKKPLEIPVTRSIRIYDRRRRQWYLGDLRRGQKVIVRNDLYNKISQEQK